MTVTTMYAKDILKRKGSHVHAIHEDEPVATATGLLAGHNIGALVVHDDEGQMTGVLSERDIVRRLADVGSQTLKLKVGAVMTRQVQTCEPKADMYHLTQRMTRCRIRHLPVMEDGRLRGIVSIGDVMKYRMEEMATEAKVLRDRLLST